MEKEQANINLRSEEIQDILGKTPAWLTRFGSLFILLALLSIVVVSAIVQYPDVVKAPIEISSSSPPIPLYTKQAGNIEELAVVNNQEVSQGEVLGILQNAANKEDVFLIELKLDSFINYPEKGQDIFFPGNVELGRIQESYANFLRSYTDYEFYDTLNTSVNSIAHIENQIKELNNITAGLKKQSLNCAAELQLLSKNYSTDLDLASKGIVSQRTVDESLADFTQKKSACEKLTIEISNNQLQIQQLKMKVFDFSTGDKQDVQIKTMLITENASKLLNEINLWKEKFLLIAPVAGFVSLNKIWSDNQYIQSDTEILSLVQRKQDLKVFAQVASRDITKVKIGQKANIRLEAYYYMEYGLIQGVVSDIAAVPRDNVYQVEIRLANGLHTTYDKDLQFAQGMLGTVEIVSSKRTFLARVFDKFKYLFSEQ